MSIVAVSTLTVGCLLSQKFSVSPLNENLNYTQGSGRGVDVAIYSGSDDFARLGNLKFSISTGSDFNMTTDADGRRHYQIQIADAGARFELTVSPAVVSGGYYGSAPSSESLGELTYVSEAGQRQKLAELICTP